MEPGHGDQWPEARGRHAACCLNYGEDHPMVLMSGGVGKDKKNERKKVLGDMWILDVDSGKWTEVKMLIYSKFLCDFKLCLYVEVRVFVYSNFRINCVKLNLIIIVCLLHPQAVIQYMHPCK